VTESVAIQFVNQWQIGAVFVAGQFASQERTEESRAEENPAAGEKWAGVGVVARKTRRKGMCAVAAFT